MTCLFLLDIDKNLNKVIEWNNDPKMNALRNKTSLENQKVEQGTKKEMTREQQRTKKIYIQSINCKTSILL